MLNAIKHTIGIMENQEKFYDQITMDLICSQKTIKDFFQSIIENNQLILSKNLISEENKQKFILFSELLKNEVK